MEEIMSEQSSMHSYLSWTKERIDEMDATLASLEARAGRVKADAQAKADRLIADLKKRRDEFQAKVKAEAAADKKQLESQWNGFEANVKTYFETVDKQIDQQPDSERFSRDAVSEATSWPQVRLEPSGISVEGAAAMPRNGRATL